MYEEYTDKQIVEILKPKLKKAIPELNWDEYLKRPDAFSIWNRLISVIYESGYIRDQLGRSFIIGEKKSEPKFERAKRWVPATEIKLQTGDKVRLANKNFYRAPWFPKNGTVGVVIASNMYSTVVQWPEGSTTRNDRWNMSSEYLEVLLCE